MTLPLFLKCIENQTFSKKYINLYIRSNNNTDNSIEIINEWLHKNKSFYNEIYTDFTDVEEKIEIYGEHEWNSTRFKILGKIREESIKWALEKKSHYFTVDCDNFIKKDTLEKIYNLNLPIVSPFIKNNAKDMHANFFTSVDDIGYPKKDNIYIEIFNENIKGLIIMPIVHCIYLIRKEYLNLMKYSDLTPRYEYVIFSENARNKNVAQYLDNRELYGYLTFAENEGDFSKEKENWDKKIFF